VEFVLAELLVAGTPIVSRQNQQGLSPYIPRDMTKLLSIGLLYFLLELMSVANAKWGRIAAWFGGLILLTVGLGEAASVAKVLDFFGNPTTAAAAPVTAAEAAGGTITDPNNAFAGQSGIPTTFGQLGAAPISGNAFAGQPGIPGTFGQLN
jgi:hypothetical protein